MLFNDLYLCLPTVACYDEAPPAEGTPAAGTGAGAGASGAAVTPNPADPNAKFTQDQVNKMMAEDRRKHKSMLEQTEATYKELLATNQTLTEKERQTLRDNLEAVSGQLRTRDMTAAQEKKQLEDDYQKRLAESAKQAKHWEEQFRGSTIERSLKDAAHKHEAYDDEQIVLFLRDHTKLVEIIDQASGKPTGKHKVMVDFADVDATTGEPIMTSRTPDEAVKRMKEIGRTQNLFKGNVVSGLGSNSSTAGITAGPNGRIDVRNLTPQQYREVRAKNPELLGLKSKGGHRR